MGMSPRGRPAIRATAGAAAAAVAAALVGCSDEPSEIGWPGGTPPPRSVAGHPSAVPSDAVEIAAAQEILTLVEEFREVEMASYADPQPPHLARRELDDYLADPLLSQTLDTLNQMVEAGVVFEGHPRWDLSVSDLRLEETPSTAVVRDCVDATDWRSVFQATGEPVPGDPRPEQYVARMYLKLYGEGWRIHDTDNEEGQC